MSISYSISIYYIEYTFAIAYTKLPIGITAWEFSYESCAIRARAITGPRKNGEGLGSEAKFVRYTSRSSV